MIGAGLGADGQRDLYPDFILLPDNGQGMGHVRLIGMIRAALIRVEHNYMTPDPD